MRLWSTFRSRRRKEEGWTDNAKTISPGNLWQGIIRSENPLPRYASRQKVDLSTMYI